MPDDFEIVGVANTTQESAQRAATALDIPKAFDSAAALARGPEVDIIAVAVKVTHHLELVKAAIAAEKHV
jgi:predicted dehydrogenase